MTPLSDKPDTFAEDLVRYVLGELDAPAARDMQAHLEECVSCRQEYHELQNDAALLALTTVGPAPPQRARERLLRGIAAEPRAQRAPAKARWRTLVPWVAATAMALFAVALWNENNAIRRQLSSLQRELTTQANNVEQLRDIVSMLTSDTTVRMTVVSTQAKPQPQGRVFYQKEKGHLMFFASNFPVLPAKKVYELWLVPMAGAPIAAGTFVPDAKGAGSVMLPAMPENVEAKTFAITIENEGGSETPTMPIIMAAP